MISSSSGKMPRSAAKTTPRFDPIGKQSTSDPNGKKVRKSRLQDSSAPLPRARLFFGDVDFMEMFEEDVPNRPDSLNNLADMLAGNSISKQKTDPPQDTPSSSTEPHQQSMGTEQNN